MPRCRRPHPLHPLHSIIRWSRLGLVGGALTVMGLDACTGDDPQSVPSVVADREAGPDSEIAADGRVNDNDGDTARDGGTATDLPPCASLVDASFCDDFNDAGALPLRWSKSTFGDGSAVAWSDAGGVFGSPAVGASIPQGLNLAGASITLTRTVARSARVRGDFRISSFGRGVGDYVMLLSVIVPTTPTVAARVISRPAAGSVALSIVDQGNGTELFAKELTGWNFADWTTIDLEVVAAPIISASVRVGTPSSLLSSLSPPTATLDASPAAQSGAAIFGAGIPLSSSTGGETRVLVDNVAVWSN